MKFNINFDSILFTKIILLALFGMNVDYTKDYLKLILNISNYVSAFNYLKDLNVQGKTVADDYDANNGRDYKYLNSYSNTIELLNKNKD